MKKILIFIILLSIPAYAIEFIDVRKKRFQENKDNMKSIYSGMKSEDYTSIYNNAKNIALWGEEMPEYFPIGSESRGASDNIWVNFELFEKAAQENKEAANRLALFAEEKNIEKIQSAFSLLSQTCKSCHKSFKN